MIEPPPSDLVLFAGLLMLGYAVCEIWVLPLFELWLDWFLGTKHD